jgi:hypothetical protein
VSRGPGGGGARGASGGCRLKREELLAIDVGSELRTLCEAQLRGTWQVPSELVRFGLRRGAAEIEVDRWWFGLRIRWRGPAVGESVLRDLRSALDRRSPATRRQRAIDTLEAAGAEALLWAAGIRGARFRVDSIGPQHRLRFTHREGGRPRLISTEDGGRRQAVELRWTCRHLDPRRAVAWLLMATRFADGTVRVNRRPVPRGFAGGLYHMRLNEPLPCRVGLTRSGDHPVLWLLKDGVVSARAGIPGYPAFEAAVELGGLVPGGASSADLRKAVAPYVRELVDRAVWMMVNVADRMGDMSDQDRVWVTALLLQAARRRLRDEEVRGIPLIPTATGRENRLSIEDISRLAPRYGHLLAAIDPDAVSGDGLVDPAATLVASSEIRGLLSELTGVRFQAPYRRTRRFTDRIRHRVRRRAADFSRRIRGATGSRPLAPDTMREEEMSLVAVLRAADPSRNIALCEGRGAVRMSSRGLLLPRENPVAIAGAACVKGDEAWAYPVLLALDLGETPPKSLRERWRKL